MVDAQAADDNSLTPMNPRRPLATAVGAAGVAGAAGGEPWQANAAGSSANPAPSKVDNPEPQNHPENDPQKDPPASGVKPKVKGKGKGGKPSPEKRGREGEPDPNEPGTAQKDAKKRKGEMLKKAHMVKQHYLQAITVHAQIKEQLKSNPAYGWANNPVQLSRLDGVEKILADIVDNSKFAKFSSLTI